MEQGPDICPIIAEGSLVPQGLLRGQIEKYLPDLRARAEQIFMKHLLCIRLRLKTQALPLG